MKNNMKWQTINGKFNAYSTVTHPIAPYSEIFSPYNAPLPLKKVAKKTEILPLTVDLRVKVATVPKSCPIPAGKALKRKKTVGKVNALPPTKEVVYSKEQLTAAVEKAKKALRRSIEKMKPVVLSNEPPAKRSRTDIPPGYISASDMEKMVQDRVDSILAGRETQKGKGVVSNAGVTSVSVHPKVLTIMYAKSLMLLMDCSFCRRWCFRRSVE